MTDLFSQRINPEASRPSLKAEEALARFEARSPKIPNVQEIRAAIRAQTESPLSSQIWEKECKKETEDKNLFNREKNFWEN
jgi:hypothetical protein